MREYIRGLRVCIYLRKSRKDLEEEARAALRGETYDTLQRHRAELLRFAQANDLIIVDILEEVISGSTLEDRTAINKVLDNVKQNKYDAVLCIAYDRLSRGDKVDQGNIEKILKKHDTLIISPQKIYDLNSEEGETSADVDGFISRMEYRRIKRRLEDGKHRSCNEGKNISSKVPFGYRKNPETKKLEILKDEAMYVEMIYSLCIEGYGTAAIATKLYNMNVKTRKGNDFTKKTVADIIKNPKYKGDQFYGVTKNGSAAKTYSYIENAHDPIITPHDWKLANKMLQQRKVSIKNSHVLKNPFATILKCCYCEHTMKAVHNRGTIRLVCTTHGCQCRSTLLDVVEAKVIEGIYDILSNIDVEVTEDDNNLLEDLQRQKDKLQNKIDELVKQRSSLHEFLEKRIYTPEVFLERQQVINDEIYNIEEKSRKLDEEIENELNRRENALNLKPVIMDCMEIYFKADPTQKNRLLRSFISKILYTRHKKDNLIKDIKIEIYLK